MDNSDIEKLYNEANVKQLVHDMDIVITPEQESIVRWAYTATYYNMDFWREAKYRNMYRGLKRPLYTPTIITPRKNRKPVDTSNFIHETTNKYYTKRYGFPFRNGVFVTGDVSLARSYVSKDVGVDGTVAVVPSVGFEYLWSTQLEDFYVDITHFINQYIIYNFDEIANALINLAEKYNINVDTTWLTKQHVKQYMIPHGIIYTIYSRRIRIDQYEELKKFRETVITNALAELDNSMMHNAGLYTAIKSGHEIMIKCDNYLAVPYNMANSVLFAETIRHLGENRK